MSNIEVGLKNPFEPMPAVIESVTTEAEDVKTFRLRLLTGEVSFTPGQFAMIHVPGVGEVPICIASSPSEKRYIEITVEKRGVVTTALHNLREGDAVGVRAPLGRGYPVEKFHGKNLVIIATGIGIAAVRSLILYVIENREKFRDVYLLYGARYLKNLLYRYEIPLWESKIKTIVTLSREKQWSGYKGRVTDHFDKIKIDEDTYFVVCGSNIVMASVASKLIMDHKVEPDRIYVSLERHMKCGIGKCARCLVSPGYYVCLHGPVFSIKEIGLKSIAEG